MRAVIMHSLFLLAISPFPDSNLYDIMSDEYRNIAYKVPYLNTLAYNMKTEPMVIFNYFFPGSSSSHATMN